MDGLPLLLYTFIHDKVGGNINLIDNMHQKIWIDTATDVECQFIQLDLCIIDNSALNPPF